MLFLISSAPDTKEFKTAYKLAKDMSADICLLQNAVYAARSLNETIRDNENNPPIPPLVKGPACPVGRGEVGLSGENTVYVLRDEMQLRGITENGISSKIIDYSQLIDLMVKTDKVLGIF